MADHQGIVIVGLGPAGAELQTREAWDWLAGCEEIYVRTRLHPAISGLPEGLRVQSFDGLYETQPSLAEVLDGIVAELLKLGRRPQGVTYAVPGSPLVAEETTLRLTAAARSEGLELQIINGLSFVEPVCAALSLDPTDSFALTDALQLGSLSVPSFPPAMPALISQLATREDASAVKLTLMANYADDFQVALVHAAGTQEQRVQWLPLHAIDRSTDLGLLSTLYVPAAEAGRSFEELQEVIARLRAPDGCPWDREQTHLTLRPYLLEEAYEVLETLDNANSGHLMEELGDLLLQILLHAQISSEDGDFTMADVILNLHHKLIRRHPHVFGDTAVHSVDQVLSNWEKIKASERKDNGETHKGLLDGIPLALPALTQADQIQRRARRVGFDWSELQPVADKVEEERQELLNAETVEEREAEAGDLLFAAVNLIRWMDVDPETALRGSNQRFRQRFAHIEAAAMAQGKTIDQLSFAEMDALWEEAKRLLAQSASAGTKDAGQEASL